MNSNDSFVNYLCVLVLAIVFAPKIIAEIVRIIKIKSSYKGNSDFKKLAIRKMVGVGMSEELVELSWGKPSDIDSVEITKDAENERWVYGKKRNRAKYVYLSNGVVYKVFLS